MKGTLVEAGAGCGKTYTIVSKYIEALGYDPETGKALGSKQTQLLLPQNIWLLTFTEDAAAEMLERILARLDRLDLSQLKQDVLENSVIGTIHSLCFRLLRPHLHALGYESQTKIVSSSLGDIVRSRHILGALSQYEKRSELMSYFESSQLVRLCLGLWFENKVFDKSTLSASFKNYRSLFEKSCSEIEKEVGESYRISCLDKNLKLGWLEESYKAFQCQELNQRREALKEINFRAGSKVIKDNYSELYKKVQSLRDFYKSQLDFIFDDSFHGIECEALGLFHEFLQYAKKEGPKILDFNSLEQELRELIVSQKPLEYIPPKLLILDEAQDTSFEQSEILRGLATPETEFFVVGDPKQSIYGFRGAEIQVFSYFKSQLEYQTLNTSRRSDADLLLFQNAFQRALFSEFKNDFDPQAQDLLPWTQIQRIPLKKPPATRILWNHDLAASYKKIFEEFRFRQSQSSEPATHALLFFKWKSIFEFSELCRAEGLPFVVSGEGVLESHHLTSLFVQFLQFLLDPNSKDLWESHERFGLKNLKPTDTEAFKRELLESPRSHVLFSYFCSLFDPLRWSLGDLWTAAMGRYLEEFEDNRVFFETHLEDLYRVLNFRRDLNVQLPELDLHRLPTNTLILSTLHGSKGLEYDFVYLPEMPKQVDSRTAFYVDDHLGITLNTQLRHQNRRVPTLQSLLPKHRKSWKEFSEKKRLLYVAMTRAKRGLSLFPLLAPPSTETKTSPLDLIGLRSPPKQNLSLWTDLTRNYLPQDQNLDNIFEEILPEGVKGEEQSEQELQSSKQEYWNWPTHHQKRKFIPFQPKFLGVSTYLNTLDKKEKTVFVPEFSEEDRHMRATFRELGSEFHRIMEVWDGKAVNLMELLKSYPPELNQKLRRALTEIQKVPELKEYFQDLSTAPEKIFREMPLLQMNQETTLFGICDALWLRSQEEAVLIDWKGSQNLTGLKKKQRLDKIRKQLEIYASAFGRRFQKTRVIAVGVELVSDPPTCQVVLDETV